MQENNLNNERIKFSFSNRLTVVNVADVHYIYSHDMNFPIGNIVDSGMNVDKYQHRFDAS